MAYVRILQAIFLYQLLNEFVEVFSYNMDISLKLNVKKTKREVSICRSEVCNRTANSLLEVMNQDADPCKDFFKFVCGKLLEKKIPEHKVTIGTFESVQDNLAKNLKNILGKEPSKTASNFVKQTKLSYQSCMDTINIDKTGVEAMNTFLVKFGGWPLLEGDKWNEKLDLTSLLTQLQLHRMLGLFDLYFHKYDPSKNFKVPLISDPNLHFPLDYYEANSGKADKLEALSQFILDMSLYLGNMEKTAKLIDDVNKTIEFEVKLAQCINSEGDSVESSQRLINLNKLKKKFIKSFDFENFFKSIFKEVNIDIVPNETIGTINMPYFSCLARLLEITPKRILANYLISKVVEQSAIAMPSAAEHITTRFTQKSVGASKTKPRQQKCITIINENLHQAVGYLYVTKMFRNTTKAKVLELISILKKAYAKHISKQNWLAPETKTQAIKKLKYMKEHVGYPDYLENVKLLDDEFEGVDFSKKTFMEILHTMRFMKMKQQMKPLRTPISRESADMPIAMVMAFYDFQMNRIVFPAGILAAPFYSDANQMYLNFGGIGTFIAHEIIHGFDNTGSKFDYMGSPNDIWKLEDRNEFKNRSECFISQYSNLVHRQIKEKVNGKLTLGENIADSGGLRMAHMAYLNWLTRNGEEKQLIGLPYNSKQMFFISYAKNFCINVTPESAAVAIRNDPHAPNMFRVNMPLKNMKAFASTFKCKRDSEMFLRKRCTIW